MSKRNPLKIDMCAGSQLRDTQGEMLSVEGADISDLENGLGKLNDNHGKGFFNSIGRITSAKKIFKAEDCENARHSYYWDKIKAPYIYVAGELYDDEDHPNARATAAILRHIHKADVPLKVKASVEGGVISRGISDPTLLARTKIHSVAITMTPANNATLVEPISLDKNQINEKTDMQLIKSVMHLAETNVPSFRHIVRDASASKVQNNLLKLVDLMKELGIEGDIVIPSKQKILQKALETKIQNNMIKIHEMTSLLREEHSLDKGVKSAIAGALSGAAVAASLAGSPNAPKAPQMNQVKAEQPVKPSQEEVYNKISKEYPLLGAIGAIESSGGKNLNHRTIASDKSMHSGHTAGGMFGMMPNTASFILKTDPELAKKYPKLAEAAKDVKTNHGKFTDRFNNDPQAAADFAVSFHNRNKDKTKNEQMLTYSWLNGLKGSWNKYNDGGMESIENHPYVQKVMEHYNKLKGDQNKPLTKAMTAGFGGGGSPGSLTGGGVIQSESLEGSPSFEYISCDNCGKDQVQSKHQVKCRHCGQSMSLEKIYNAMNKKKKKKK